MRFVLFLMLIAATLSAAPVPKALKKATGIDGDWRMESTERNGKMGQPPGGDYNLWRVHGETIDLVREPEPGRPDRGDNIYPCQFVSEIRPEAPRTFEYKVLKNGYHRHGVCELDGDTLRVAFSSDAKSPPTAVQSSNTVTIYVFKRVR